MQESNDPKVNSQSEVDEVMEEAKATQKLVDQENTARKPLTDKQAEGQEQWRKDFTEQNGVSKP